MTAPLRLLTIVIPVFNEESFIEAILDRVVGVDMAQFGLEKEIIIVDDSSTDGTPERLLE